MKRWDGKSKGSVLGYKIFVFFIKKCGISVAYFLLRMVSFYYFLFAKKNRNGIINFYQNALHLSRKKATKTARRNFYIFGQTLIDRVAFLVGKTSQYTFSFENEKALLTMKDAGKGGVLLSAHHGNWESAGNLIRQRITANINVLMYEDEANKVQQYLKNTIGEVHFNVIPIKDDFSHVIKIHQVLSSNELVAIHADRFMENAKYIELDFFGKKAKFPLGPFLIATKFKVPVSFVFAIKTSDFHYHLSATDPIFSDSPEEIAKKYIAELEKKVNSQPEQWFNYYDFFG